MYKNLIFGTLLTFLVLRRIKHLEIGVMRVFLKSVLIIGFS